MIRLLGELEGNQRVGVYIYGVHSRSIMQDGRK